MKIRITESQLSKVLLTEENVNIDFEELYETLWDKMLHTNCKKYTKDINKAMDYCQNGFMKVYQNLHKFDGSGSLEGWVRRVISNNIKDEIRKNKIELHNTEYDIGRIEVPVENYKEPNVDEIIRVIPMLPPSYRKTFELYYLRGYNIREIADMLGVTESTSKTNLMKGRNMIKKYFKDNPQIDIY